jgi:hypothetical protein
MINSIKSKDTGYLIPSSKEVIRIQSLYNFSRVEMFSINDTLTLAFQPKSLNQLGYFKFTYWRDKTLNAAELALL